MDGYLKLILAPLAGHNVNYINQLINDYLTRWVKPNVYQQGIKLINEYKRRGDAVFLLSASIDVLVQPIGYHMFGIDHADIAAVETIKEQGVFTGQYVKPIPFGQGKLGRFRQLLADRPYLEQTVFYTDSLDDLPLLQQVDQPVVVNGSAQLLALAYQKGWSTMHLTQ
jgi:HAD superfamily hydrolase (TIGR01490 family)